MDPAVQADGQPKKEDNKINLFGDHDEFNFEGVKIDAEDEGQPQNNM
jgi:hypothetical protein|tara:strand:+ start:2589 stop:2729 length:141 start_codon:yes stop_codon:yes gene_type:complete